MPLRALARVNLAAIERNVALLKRSLTSGASLCAVVKGNGYGHGAVPSARAALAASAGWLAVATADEAAELRAGGIHARILVMGALGEPELPVALAAGADVVAWSQEFVVELERAAATRAAAGRVGVHVKLDSGMGRLGTREPDGAVAVAERVLAGPLELVGAMTHFATADGDQEFVGRQLEAFAPFVARLRALAPGIVVHAANSAATLRTPASHFDAARCGIAIYGCDPMNQDPLAHGLEPALELSSYVAAVKRAGAGESAGYGRRFVAERDTWLATVPIGYADGVSRGLTNNGEVLIDGVRRPIVGAVSMDNITVELGPDPVAAVGDPVVLIGAAGGQRITAEEVAGRLGTINYEVVCAISARVPRLHHRDGEPA